MRAPLSVVIPTLDAAAELPACLAALMEGLEAGLIREVVVSDGGSTDATAAIAGAAGAVTITGPASRGGQLRRGVAAARGAWLLVLHADTRLAPGWADVVAARIAQGGPAGHFRMRFRARGAWPWWVAGWANRRAAWFGLPYGDQGLLVSRADYAVAGGYPDQPLMEDVALARRLRLRPLDAVATTSADRYLRGGWARRGARNLWTLARYLAGADPERLAAAYRRR
ncbi:MAG: TIGR04283 family arsenosugar biosynthesis glycosyltransferase [Shimia sp.]